MLIDIWTMVGKEWKEMLGRRGGWRAGLLPMLVFPVLLMGIVIPAQAGLEWVKWIGMVSVGFWLPQLLVLSVVADSFAGERERHTLETLLATRLSDQSILLGKLAAAVSYACVSSLISAVVSLITVNSLELAAGRPLVCFSAEMIVAMGVFAVLTSGLAAGLGILVSLRSPTVRQAQQTLSMATLFITIGLSILVGATPQSWIQAIAHGIQAAGPILVALVSVGLLILLDLGLVLIALARFRRAQLILD